MNAAGAESPWRLGIDASNLRAGGTITHLSEILAAAEPEAVGLTRVTVWSNRSMLDALPDRPWLERVHSPLLDGALPQRLFWQLRTLDRAAAASCDLLYAPGGNYVGKFHPFVTMSRNMLPFDAPAAALYGFSYTRARLAILTRSQQSTFRSADGVIFLTRTARETVERHTGKLPGAVAMIPHGVSSRFVRPPRPQRALSDYSFDRPFRFGYVSIVDVYKYQWTVAEAAARLRADGLPVVLDLWGPVYPPAKARLDEVLRRVDPKGDVVRFHGSAKGQALVEAYHGSDAFVFASSCENMPNILVEAMASGLPIACSDRSVMPEILGDAGEFFDPADVDSVTAAMRKLATDPHLRGQHAAAAFDRASAFSWKRCAGETFRFLADVRHRYTAATCAAS